jgi:hypothetical protein
MDVSEHVCFVTENHAVLERCWTLAFPRYRGLNDEAGRGKVNRNLPKYGLTRSLQPIPEAHFSGKRIRLSGQRACEIR